MTKALENVRVLDLTHIYNGPYATLVLGFLGAEVIKLEPPHRGENARMIYKVPGSEESFPFIMLNSNKKGITLNLKSARGQEVFKELVRRSDVLAENFAVGVMDRLGLGYEVLKHLNPRLIYATGTGYGLRGPYSPYPAFDPVIQAMAGVMSTTGFPDGPPLKAGPAVMDILGGIHLAAGILAALYQRDRTGEGMLVETSLYDAAVVPLITHISSYLAQGGMLERSGNTAPGKVFSPYNCYAARDGYVLLLGAEGQKWQALCKLIGREELATDPRFATNAARAQRANEVDAIVGAWIAERSKQELMERLVAADIPCGIVKEVPEVLADPHLRARGTLQDVSIPRWGKSPCWPHPCGLPARPPPFTPRVPPWDSTTSRSTESCLDSPRPSWLRSKSRG